MARNRTPLKKAAVAGRNIVNPGRYENRKEPSNTRPIGEPYRGMTDPQIAYWKEFASELPWLNSSHRMLLRLTCQLAARMDSGEEMGVSASHALSSLLSKLGATPVDQSKVATWGDDDEDEDEAFFGRPN